MEKLKRQRILIFTAAVLIVTAVLTVQIIASTAAELSDISNSVLRLHIIAEDDEPKSQLLKLCVRDRILRDFSDIFKRCDDIDTCRAEAVNNIDKIKQAAEDELVRCGSPSNVNVYVGRSDFPTKSYGGVTLPCGEYSAVKVEIGNADGRNWWCVMYPPLCVTEGNAVIPKGSLDKLRTTLSKEEYRLITEQNSPNIKLKFKIAEILGKYFNK